MSAAPLLRRTATLAALAAVVAGAAVAPANAAIAQPVSAKSTVTVTVKKDTIFTATGRKAG